MLIVQSLRQWRHRIWGFNLYNRDQWIKKQADSLPPQSRILDVGAGMGRYRSYFEHCEYKTQDFGQEPQTVGQYTPLDFESDITEIPVPEQSFDAVLCSEVLEHVPVPDQAVREMARILKPGGCLMLTAPLGSFLHQEPFHFYGGFTPHWYRKFLPEVGLEIKSLEPNQGFFSWYGQETQRYCSLIAPPRAWKVGGLCGLGMVMLWLILRPLAALLPWVGNRLDRLQLDATATIGYHILAIKRNSAGEATP